MEEEAEVKFTSARIQLMKENPFFSFLALSLKPQPTDKVERIAIDVRGTVYYNPGWLASLPLAQVKTAIAHEIGHLVTDTFERGKDRNALLWNIATDQVWNEVLKKNGFTPITGRYGGWFCEKRFFGMTADEVYYALFRNQSERSMKFYGKASFDEILFIDEYGNVYDRRGNKIGEARDEDGNPINGSVIQERFGRYWKERVKEAEIFARTEGKTPEGVPRLIDDLFTPRWSPRALLEKYISQELAEPNWQFADKKRSGEAIFPAEREEALIVGFAIDTSGSMSEREIALCKGAIKHLFSICEAVRVEVVECDAENQDSYDVDRQSLRAFLRKSTFKGGGGTDFRPVISHFNKKHPRILLYATDLCCTTFGEKPSYDVIWLKVGSEAGEKPPYGRVISLAEGV